MENEKLEVIENDDFEKLCTEAKQELSNGKGDVENE